MGGEAAPFVVQVDGEGGCGFRPDDSVQLREPVLSGQFHVP